MTILFCFPNRELQAASFIFWRHNSPEILTMEGFDGAGNKSCLRLYLNVYFHHLFSIRNFTSLFRLIFILFAVLHLLNFQAFPPQSSLFIPTCNYPLGASPCFVLTQSSIYISFLEFTVYIWQPQYFAFSSNFIVLLLNRTLTTHFSIIFTTLYGAGVSGPFFCLILLFPWAAGIAVSKKKNT